MRTEIRNKMENRKQLTSIQFRELEFYTTPYNYMGFRFNNYNIAMSNIVKRV